MSTHAKTLEIDIRAFRVEDQDAVLGLMRAALGAGPVGDRTQEFFGWKHMDSPFGSSFMLVAEVDGRIVGLRAFLRWRFRSGDRRISAVRAVDTATHPDYQGQGIFSKLTREAIDRLRTEVDLVFNTPNDKSGPGYLKLGWRSVGQIPISFRVRRPLRFLRRARTFKSMDAPVTDRPEVTAQTAAEALARADEVSQLLDAVREPSNRLETDRTVDYLRWRYATVPTLDYRAVRDDRGGGLNGLALFRVRSRGQSWETTVTELLVPPQDVTTAHRLIREVRRAAGVDHLTCSFPAGSSAARGGRRAGFIRSPVGIKLVVNPLREDLEPDPSRMGSWALSLGDLEVF
jgi:GNAT superfamily N-acetyltransferase